MLKDKNRKLCRLLHLFVFSAFSVPSAVNYYNLNNSEFAVRICIDEENGMFKKGPIEGVVIKSIRKFVDERGWLAELFREDDLNSKILMPVMSYISFTLPGIVRGPHEHVEQTDYFCFIGPSNFKLVLWDNRKSAVSFGNKMVIFVGEDNPASVIIPEGVVHAYMNVGSKDGAVINFPNRLFMGEGKRSSVDEIRYEDDPNSPFNLHV